MTNLVALKSEVEPYSLSSDEGYVKKLIDSDLMADDEYTKSNKLTIAQCAISILISFLSLSSETLGPTGQSYDRKGLEQRIQAICDENGFDMQDFVEKPRVKMYRNLF